MDNNIEIVGTNGIVTEFLAKNAFEKVILLSLDYDIKEKIDKINCKVDYEHFDELAWSTECQINSLKDKNEKLQNEVKELRKIVANLNTRVNNLIAEKQLKEFYEKNGSDKCVSSVVEKQLVISN